MTTQRNPENKQEHRPHDLGQIIAVQRQPPNEDSVFSEPKKQNPNPWVIVEKAGTDDESIYSDHATYRAAILNAIEFLGRDFYEEGFDIMRRNDDGTLTTEF